MSGVVEQWNLHHLATKLNVRFLSSTRQRRNCFQKQSLKKPTKAALRKKKNGTEDNEGKKLIRLNSNGCPKDGKWMIKKLLGRIDLKANYASFKGLIQIEVLFDVPNKTKAKKKLHKYINE